jgi:hypothetical protein
VSLSVAGAAALACHADVLMLLVLFDAVAGGLCSICGLCSQRYLYGLDHVASSVAFMAWTKWCSGVNYVTAYASHCNTSMSITCTFGFAFCPVAVYTMILCFCRPL